MKDIPTSTTSLTPIPDAGQLQRMATQRPPLVHPLTKEQDLVTKLSAVTLASSDSSEEDTCVGWKVASTWTILKTLGRGGFGVVWLAENDSTGEVVAIKRIDKTAMNSQQRKNCKREVRVLELLLHPNIVKTFGVLEEHVSASWFGQGTVVWKNWWQDVEKCLVSPASDLHNVPMTPLENYHRNSYQTIIVMEHMSGGDLFQHVSENKRLDETIAREYCRQICHALVYCHAHSHIHRDLKLENILLTNNHDHVKLADFGFARSIESDLLNTFCGTLCYAAPELLQTKPYIGPKVDSWALGVCLYGMLTGNMPFGSGQDPANLAQAIRSGVFATPSYMSAGARDVLRCLLRVDFEERTSVERVLLHPWLYDCMDQLPFSVQQRTEYEALLSMPMNTVIALLCQRYNVDPVAVETGLQADWKRSLRDKGTYGRALSIYLLVAVKFKRLQPIANSTSLETLNYTTSDYSSSSNGFNKGERKSIAERRGRKIAPITTLVKSVEKKETTSRFSRLFSLWKS
jgi:serine/threonine protein kinase